MEVGRDGDSRRTDRILLSEYIHGTLLGILQLAEQPKAKAGRVGLAASQSGKLPHGRAAVHHEFMGKAHQRRLSIPADEYREHEQPSRMTVAIDENISIHRSMSLSDAAVPHAQKMPSLA